MMTIISRFDEYRNFVDWYFERFGERPAEKCVFVTSICGHFHTFRKGGEMICKEMADFGLIKMKGGIIWKVK